MGNPSGNSEWGKPPRPRCLTTALATLHPSFVVYDQINVKLKRHSQHRKERFAILGEALEYLGDSSIGMDWKEISGNWVLMKRNPIGIIHFLGGAFVATAPHLTYRHLLEELASKGYVVIATPFVNTLDHSAIAMTVQLNFERTLERLHEKEVLGKRYLPIYGIGHSMGCKIHLLIGSLCAVERAGNILISFNNYAARDAIPLLEQLNTFNVEFTPSPLETNRLVQERYTIRRNLLIKFSNDTLDQSAALTELLQKRFAEMVTQQTLPGTHTTPLGQDIKWQTGESFTPFDALGQWFKQEVYRDLNQLKRTILLWLNPLSI